MQIAEKVAFTQFGYLSFLYSSASLTTGVPLTVCTFQQQLDFQNINKCHGRVLC